MPQYNEAVPEGAPFGGAYLGKLNFEGKIMRRTRICKSHFARVYLFTCYGWSWYKSWRVNPSCHFVERPRFMWKNAITSSGKPFFWISQFSANDGSPILVIHIIF
jgi:hypothetical protein